MVTEPIADTTDRESLIRWLVWNDPNGCWTDEDAVAEWGEPNSLQTLQECYRYQTGPDL